MAFLVSIIKKFFSDYKGNRELSIEWELIINEVDIHSTYFITDIHKKIDNSYSPVIIKNGIGKKIILTMLTKL